MNECCLYFIFKDEWSNETALDDSIVLHSCADYVGRKIGLQLSRLYLHVSLLFIFFSLRQKNHKIILFLKRTMPQKKNLKNFKEESCGKNTDTISNATARV